jgi:hypothetical protein
MTVFYGAGEETLELPASEDAEFGLSTIIIFQEVESEKSQSIPNAKPQRRGWGVTFGAGEETLTLDLFLGKEAL